MSHHRDYDAGDEYNRVDGLRLEANALHTLGASVLHSEDIGTHAIEYGVNNWPIIPLNGKLPAIPNPHPKGSRERQECHGECHLYGHGVHDATIDVTVLASWWGGLYTGCNIGGRVPESMFVLDVDPRNGGLESLAELETAHGSLPETLMTLSGRGDGGCHRFFRRPPGRLSCKLLGPGIDLKTSQTSRPHRRGSKSVGCDREKKSWLGRPRDPTAEQVAETMSLKASLHCRADVVLL